VYIATNHKSYTLHKLEDIKYDLDKYLGRMDLENNTAYDEVEAIFNKLKREINESISKINNIPL